MLHTVQILATIGRFDVYLLRRLPVLFIVVLLFPLGEAFVFSIRFTEVYILEIWSHFQMFISLSFRSFKVQI